MTQAFWNVTNEIQRGEWTSAHSIPWTVLWLATDLLENMAPITTECLRVCATPLGMENNIELSIPVRMEKI